MTGIRPPASRAGPRSPAGAGSPPAPQGAGSESIGRGLNNISGARRPPKSATMNTRCRRASRGLAQCWASMSRHARSGTPPRTIPAFAHLPEAGIGTSEPVSAERTALKSIRFPDENAPMTFSQRAIVGNLPPVASLISGMMRIASKKRPDFSPVMPVRLPICERFWHGEPKVMIWTGGICPPSSLVMSPKCAIPGKWRLVIDTGAFSISLAHIGTIPCRWAARGNTPIPSNRLPNVSAPPIFNAPQRRFWRCRLS